MRQYQPIWTRLKRDKVVKITAHKALHPRIIKAVIKEKWLDIAYKLELDHRKAVLTHSVEGTIITFFLTLTASSLSDKDF